MKMKPMDDYEIESHSYVDGCCMEVKQPKMDSNHKSYLGHFSQEKYLKEGHNTSGSMPMGIFDPFSKEYGAETRMEQEKREKEQKIGQGIVKMIQDDSDETKVRAIGRAQKRKMAESGY